MPPSPRNALVLSGVAGLTCIAFLFEPEWYLREAHNLCTGQVFGSLDACVAEPACVCARPLNPWAFVYWLAFLAGVGIAAALLLRTRLLPSAICLLGAIAVGGYCGFFLLSRQPLFEPEAWAFAPIVIAIYASIALIAFGLARLVRQFIAKRRSAT